MNRSLPLSFRVVGLGRAGRSLVGALTRSGWSYLGGFGRADDPSGAASNVDAVIIAVPDDAISDVAAAITPTTAVLIHLSGTKTLQVLAPHQRRASVHPLISLPDAETGADRLRSGATFAVAGDPTAAALVAALGGRAIAVEDEHRALYHGAAAVAANHLVVLCAQVERMAARASVPVAHYWELMASTLDNVGRVGALAALTGPAARGDDDTLDAHIRALAELGSGEVDLYRTLAAEARRLGETQPMVDHPDTRPTEAPESSPGRQQGHQK